MTDLNTLADLVGPVYLQLAYLGITFCFGWFAKQGWDWAWPEVRYRYKRFRVREFREEAKPLRVVRGRGV